MKHILFGVLMLCALNTLSSQESMLITYEFRVEGMCGMCQDRIEKTAIEKANASSASWDIETKILSVSIDEEVTSISKVKWVLAQAGHDNGKYLAPDEVYANIHDCCRYRPEPEFTTYEFRVEGMCGMCQERIETHAIEQGGAESASWDMDSKLLTVVINEAEYSISDLRSSLALAGHDNGMYKATDEVYDNMHHCCKYRELDEDLNNQNQVEKNTELEEQNSGHIHNIKGRIFGLDDQGKKMALIGANVKLLGAKEGTTTDFDGYFELDNSQAHASSIEISYIGFENKVIRIDNEGAVEIILDPGHQLETVEISYKKKTTEISFIKPLNVENITKEELCKAACCNLSESFETNPSVDVSFPDAITGTRQIQMLGLAGPYVQITRELIPDVRAMSNIYGLSMTPGPWIESIQLIKGAGSVVNGFESIVGQINVELRKPERGEKVFLNGYANYAGRLEFNGVFRQDLAENVSSSLLVHAKQMSEPHDNNGDSFTDMPIEEDFVVANRWKFKRKKNLEGQLGFKVSNQEHEGGSHDHFDGVNEDHENHWRMRMKNTRYEVWGKMGYVNEDAPENSVGLQVSAVRQDQDGSFGNDLYITEQNSIYANLIFQHLGGDKHIIRTGLSYQLDDISERVGKAGFFDRFESVPGAYFEYTYKESDKFSIIPGIRVDHHNNYGTFITPRLHAKYNLGEKSIVRLSAGRGFRTANIFIENIGLFSSARAVNLESTDNGNPYGLNAEVAWNYGINYTQALTLFDKELVMSLDFYRTDFENQIVVDFETAGLVSFYNLEGQSYSNSFQIKFEYPLLRNLDIRTAYRLFDVQTDFNSGRNSKPLISKHRAFINLAYKTDSDWHFDATLNWNGQKRLPDTSRNPEKYQRPDYSPNYFLMNAQIMKRWGTKWDVYLGAENLFNYKQTDAIIAAEDPFGPFFDASIVWAPLFGTNVYVGFRYNLSE